VPDRSISRARAHTCTNTHTHTYTHMHRFIQSPLKSYVQPLMLSDPHFPQKLGDTYKSPWLWFCFMIFIAFVLTRKCAQEVTGCGILLCACSVFIMCLCRRVLWCAHIDSYLRCAHTDSYLWFSYSDSYLRCAHIDSYLRCAHINSHLQCAHIVSYLRCAQIDSYLWYAHIDSYLRCAHINSHLRCAHIDSHLQCAHINSQIFVVCSYRLACTCAVCPAGGVPVVDAVVLTSVWAVAVLRSLSLVSVCHLLKSVWCLSARVRVAYFKYDIYRVRGDRGAAKSLTIIADTVAAVSALLLASVHRHTQCCSA